MRVELFEKFGDNTDKISLKKNIYAVFPQLSFSLTLLPPPLHSIYPVEAPCRLLSLH